MVAPARLSRAFAWPSSAALRTHGVSRSLHMSRVVRAAPAPTSAEQTAQYPSEGFNSSLWKYALLALVGGIVAVRARPATKQEETKPYLTELLESLFVPKEEVQEENRKHLDWSMKKAEAQLLFQDAQKPPAHRFKFPAALDQYPQRSIPVGSQLDASDIQPNKERV
ncbi:Uncharacterized protein MSYG_1100 [Malassezia sympodialis ATCC 42132]|uniref:Uncharacterized protein n=1 Tax=Malassezia sympodialis (strain ATCC 42132) TaxID=1230383 RepID=A0A1M8A2X9_MALS4|nr:Uncharacterized protein MSYG_1100 [Malassezia sympodialis ATCC 42132]